MRDYKIYAFADEADSQIDGQIRALKRNGLDGLEIRGVDGQNVSEISLLKAKEVRKKLDDHDLSVWSIGSPVGKIHIDQDFSAHLDIFKHILDVAKILGADNMRIFSFYMTQQERNNNRKHVIDRLGQMLEIAESFNVQLCHENEKGIYGTDAEHCLDLHRTLPALKSVFDPANFVQCGEDTLRAWSILKPYVSYIHIKDSLADGSVVPAGKGDGNLAAIIKGFLADGHKNMTLEPHLTVFEGLKALEEEGNTSSVNNSAYATADIAFDAGCKALFDILKGV